MNQICPHDHHISEKKFPGLRHAILREILLGRIDLSPALFSPQAGPFQVLLLRPCTPGQTPNVAAFTEKLRITSQAEYLGDLIYLGDDLALLLCSQTVIGKFAEFIKHRHQEDSAINRMLSFPEPLFLACGRIANDVSDIPTSFQDALSLLKQSFFCEPGQHLLCMEEMPNRASQPPVIHGLLLEKYTARLLQCIQSFNRSLTSQVLTELEDILIAGSDPQEEVRLFYADLYLQIKEQMKYLYPEYAIPFYSNAHILKILLHATCLHDITCFLAQRFDMIMSSIGAFTRESVLDDILHYIRHNYTTNITLEGLAPLFGYNHSYLGKIFRKKMGVCFNAYVDRLRIERAKELLLQDNAKVYAVSEQVGYKNVDYFHVKFRKYVNMSPVEFRKAHQTPESKA